MIYLPLFVTRFSLIFLSETSLSISFLRPWTAVTSAFSRILCFIPTNTHFNENINLSILATNQPSFRLIWQYLKRFLKYLKWNDAWGFGWSCTAKLLALVRIDLAKTRMEVKISLGARITFATSSPNCSSVSFPTNPQFRLFFWILIIKFY